MASKRKSSQVEVNFKINIKKIFETVIGDDDRVALNSEKSSPFVTQQDNNGCTSQILTSDNVPSSEKVAELMQLALNSTVLVDALEPIPVLKKKCALLGINGNFSYRVTNHEEVNANTCGKYVFERILDHDTVNHLYYVKWKSYSTEFNTWEPIDHLSSVSDEVHAFRLMERSLSEDDKIAYKKLIFLNCLLDEIITPANEDPYVLLKLNGKSSAEYKPEDLVELKSQLKHKIRFLKKSLKEDQNKFQLNYGRILEKTMKNIHIIVAFGSIENLEDAIKRRRRFFSRLTTWAANINRLISREGGAIIGIENNCDFDMPPEDFTYVTKCKSGSDVVSISQEPSWFCNCESGCRNDTKNCCPKLNGSKRIYNNRGSLKNLEQTVIFECNSKCKCPSTCSNRVIQHGQKFKLGIFKTEDGRGWGVKALEQIPKGQFIVEYVGEIITKQEAETRSGFGENPSYLFDLDYGIETDIDYVVDGARFGNVSRFVNHSCSPNMEVYMFWIDNSNKKMPRIAFFSQKFIASGKELTFDYRMTAPGTAYIDESDSSLIKVPCKCQSVKCRKFLF